MIIIAVLVGDVVGVFVVSSCIALAIVVLFTAGDSPANRT
jgi:hypothetical protein